MNICIKRVKMVVCQKSGEYAFEIYGYSDPVLISDVSFLESEAPCV